MPGRSDNGLAIPGFPVSLPSSGPSSDLHACQSGRLFEDAEEGPGAVYAIALRAADLRDDGQFLELGHRTLGRGERHAEPLRCSLVPSIRLDRTASRRTN